MSDRIKVFVQAICFTAIVIILLSTVLRSTSYSLDFDQASLETAVRELVCSVLEDPPTPGSGGALSPEQQELVEGIKGLACALDPILCNCINVDVSLLKPGATDIFDGVLAGRYCGGFIQIAPERFDHIYLLLETLIHELTHCAIEHESEINDQNEYETECEYILEEIQVISRVISTLTYLELLGQNPAILEAMLSEFGVSPGIIEEIIDKLEDLPLIIEELQRQLQEDWFEELAEIQKIEDCPRSSPTPTPIPTSIPIQTSTPAPFFTPVP
jgi:hypothetical protein